MNIDYSYLKLRAQFGSPCYYVNDGPNVVESLMPDKSLADTYILKNPVDKATQESKIMSLHEANTWRPDFSDRGMYHDQGGWPKDLNVQDDEAVLRYRKKLEREDNYVASMRALTKPIEHAILQNNAINIYEQYFDDALKAYSANESLTLIRNIYRDPRSLDKSLEVPRSVSHISWAPERGQFAASYCNVKYQRQNMQESTEAFIWNVEIPSAPETIFDSRIPIVNLEWNPMDHNILVGGLYSGQIGLYDLRKAPEHVELTPDVVSHRDFVHSVIWINSKTGTEFFTTSADGVVKWWDYRNLSQTTDSIILDVSKSQSMVNAYGASCLEFDPTIPAKYLVGTETGHVICGNRKGVTLSEKLAWVLKAHVGPIYSVMRNQAFSKMFMTVAEWGARIWSEECKESAVMWIRNYRVNLTCGEWSKGRYSAFCLSRADGCLDVWDVLLDQQNPYVSIKVSDKPLNTLRMDDEGRFVVTGDDSGKCFLIQFGESLSTCARNDKNNLSAMFDRENRREKILEGRNREIRLALKLKAQQAEEAKEAEGEVIETEEPEQDPEIRRAEEEYWEDVHKAMDMYKDGGKKKEEKEATEVAEAKEPPPTPEVKEEAEVAEEAK